MTPMVAPPTLIAPYGASGTLVNLLVTDPAEHTVLREQAQRLAAIQLTPRNLCDLELLATGGFSPLSQFMGQADYERVLHELRLADGTLFPLPITLTVDPAQLVGVGEQLALRDTRNNVVAIMDLEQTFDWSPDTEARLALGTTDTRHPLVAEMQQWGRVAIAGRLRVLALPTSYDFTDLRLTPAQVRERLIQLGYANVVAFQTRNPLHRIHEELTRRAAAAINGSLLIHPVVGLTKPGDVDHFTRVRIYRALVDNYYDPQRTLLSLLPLAMRMAGPREALLHGLIRRNYGANHFIIGRDHAGPGNDSTGKPFYEPYAAQELFQQHAAELGVTAVPFQELLYLPDTDEYVEAHAVPTGARVATISGTQVREEYLAKGRLLPTWFTRPETAQILAESYPPRHQQGFCLWFTGLSGAGKSTIAEIVTVLLLERGRQATVLDGDVVRTHLSKGLGFSRADRDANILRIGFVASEVVRHRGVAICAAISPYRATRDAVRDLVGAEQFFEIFVDAPLAVCEARDPKGLYAKARRGELVGFTGIDDPYEPPLQPELHLKTATCDAATCARQIVQALEQRGFLLPRP